MMNNNLPQIKQQTLSFSFYTNNIENIVRNNTFGGCKVVSIDYENDCYNWFTIEIEKPQFNWGVESLLATLGEYVYEFTNQFTKVATTSELEQLLYSLIDCARQDIDECNNIDDYDDFIVFLLNACYEIKGENWDDLLSYFNETQTCEYYG